MTNGRGPKPVCIQKIKSRYFHGYPTNSETDLRFVQKERQIRDKVCSRRLDYDKAPWRFFFLFFPGTITRARVK